MIVESLAWSLFTSSILMCLLSVTSPMERIRDLCPTFLLLNEIPSCSAYGRYQLITVRRQMLSKVLSIVATTKEVSVADIFHQPGFHRTTILSIIRLPKGNDLAASLITNEVDVKMQQSKNASAHSSTTIILNRNLECS